MNRGRNGPPPSPAIRAGSRAGACTTVLGATLAGMTGAVAALNRQPISDETWEGISREFTLPTQELVRRRLSELMEDPESVMRQLVRVFIDEGTFCPGFQFLPGGQLHPTVIELLRRAMVLDIPQTTYRLDGHDVQGSCRTPPVDHLKGGPAPCCARWNPRTGARTGALRRFTAPAGCVALAHGTHL